MDYAKMSYSIKARRKEMGLTQAELAQKSGLSQATISRCENPETLKGLSIVNFVLICAALRIDALITPRGEKEDWAVRGLQHAKKQETTYRASRRALNSWGKQKDRTASRKPKSRKRK